MMQLSCQAHSHANALPCFAVCYMAHVLMLHGSYWYTLYALLVYAIGYATCMARAEGIPGTPHFDGSLSLAEAPLLQPHKMWKNHLVRCAQISFEITIFGMNLARYEGVNAEMRVDDKSPLRLREAENETYAAETQWTERVRSILLAQPLNPLAPLAFRPLPKLIEGAYE